MKVTLPENISEITLDQGIAIEELRAKELTEEDLKDEIIKLFTGIENTSNIVKKDLDEVLGQILIALSNPCKFEPIFVLDGVKYGFEPDLDNISGAQWAALLKYEKEIKDLAKLMSVLFRPITKEDTFNNYLIEPFEHTGKHSEKLLQMPMHIVNGARGFFLTLENELLIHTLRYTQKKIKKAKRKAKSRMLKSGLWRSGGGTQSLQT